MKPATNHPSSPYSSLAFSLLLHGGLAAGIVALPLLQQPMPQPMPAQTITLVNAADIAQAPQPAIQAAPPTPRQIEQPAKLPETKPAETKPADIKPVETKAPEAEPELAIAPRPKTKPLPPQPAKPVAKPTPQATQQPEPPKPAPEIANAASNNQINPNPEPAPQNTHRQAALPAAPQEIATQENGDADSKEPPVLREARFRRPPKPPQYPPRSLSLEQQGVSVVRALIDIDGASREVRLWRSSGHEALDRAAIAAVRGWAFEAARIGDRPVLAWVEIPVRFEIR